MSLWKEGKKEVRCFGLTSVLGDICTKWYDADSSLGVNHWIIQNGILKFVV